MKICRRWNWTGGTYFWKEENESKIEKAEKSWMWGYFFIFNGITGALKNVLLSGSRYRVDYFEYPLEEKNSDEFCMWFGLMKSMVIWQTHVKEEVICIETEKPSEFLILIWVWIRGWCSLKLVLLNIVIS